MSKMSKLSIQDITTLASRNKVSRISVESFLMSMGEDSDIVRLDLQRDIQRYKYNKETVKAIEDGIHYAELKAATIPLQGNGGWNH